MKQEINFFFYLIFLFLDENGAGNYLINIVVKNEFFLFFTKSVKWK